MRIELLESKVGRRRNPNGTVASILLHAAIITFAVAATATARDRVKAEPTPIRVSWFPTAQTYDPVSLSLSAAPTVPQAPKFTIVPPANISLGIPPVDLLAHAVDIDNASFRRGFIEAAADTAREARGISGPLTGEQVEKAARALPGAAPRYPDALRAAGVEGEVIAEFVVDENGRARPETFHTVASTNDLFASAVRTALSRMRFVPAEFAGKKVAQLVEQRFEFRLSR